MEVTNKLTLLIYNLMIKIRLPLILISTQNTSSTAIYISQKGAHPNHIHTRNHWQCFFIFSTWSANQKLKMHITRWNHWQSGWGNCIFCNFQLRWRWTWTPWSCYSWNRIKHHHRSYIQNTFSSWWAQITT